MNQNYSVNVHTRFKLVSLLFGKTHEFTLQLCFTYNLLVIIVILRKWKWVGLDKNGKWVGLDKNGCLDFEI